MKMLMVVPGVYDLDLAVTAILNSGFQLNMHEIHILLNVAIIIRSIFCSLVLLARINDQPAFLGFVSKQNSYWSGCQASQVTSIPDNLNFFIQHFALPHHLS